MVAVSQLWFAGVPLALGVAGWVACRRKAVASALLFGGLLFPLYHLATANPVATASTRSSASSSRSRSPASSSAGPARPARRRARDARGRRRRAFGVAQAQRIDRAWVDVTRRRGTSPRTPGPATASSSTTPGPSPAASTRPARCATRGRRRHLPPRPPAGRPAHLPLRLFVAPRRRAVAGGAAPRVAACGTFRRVFASSAPVTSLGRSLRFVTWTGHVEVFRNTRRRARAARAPARVPPDGRREPRAPTARGR